MESLLEIDKILLRNVLERKGKSIIDEWNEPSALLYARKMTIDRIKIN